MTTRDQIIHHADTLIRELGYNAFSFYDISKTIGIKTASIHYYFPSKSDLGVAVIEQSIENLNLLIEKYRSKSPIEKLDRFLGIYSAIKYENKVCLVGSLAPDFNTLDEKVQDKLKIFSDSVISWVSSFLDEGRNSNIFEFEGESRTKAILIITNMLAIVQLSRLTGDQDFEIIKNGVKNNLLKDEYGGN
jgi:AcrR family transcriptional regulator